MIGYSNTVLATAVDMLFPGYWSLVIARVVSGVAYAGFGGCTVTFGEISPLK
ncbi:hypothetical protein ID852_09685 [Xenorhabdus sp. 42]|uniref:hypothetical protein n=1 Tax=Xenorhabdus szentirmaii TaxID=290112 RepID=UPI001997A6C4|nr:hypothetical protein [Xenorhabdus sp. 42]MBD2820959.1 hypothetical protein [Xenorhabdus sp. 42]